MKLIRVLLVGFDNEPVIEGFEFNSIEIIDNCPITNKEILYFSEQIVKSTDIILVNLEGDSFNKFEWALLNTNITPILGVGKTDDEFLKTICVNSFSNLEEAVEHIKAFYIWVWRGIFNA